MFCAMTLVWLTAYALVVDESGRVAAPSASPPRDRGGDGHSADRARRAPRGGAAVTVAVVGLGAMGSRMAGRLLDAGYEVVVWNRTEEKAKPLVERRRGLAGVAARRGGACGGADHDGDGSGLTRVCPGRLTPDAMTLIQMSTVGPAAMERLASAFPKLLDAPVLGSIGEAESGALTDLRRRPGALVEQVDAAALGARSADARRSSRRRVGREARREHDACRRDRRCSANRSRSAKVSAFRAMSFRVLATTALAQQAERDAGGRERRLPAALRVVAGAKRRRPDRGSSRARNRGPMSGAGGPPLVC